MTETITPNRDYAETAWLIVNGADSTLADFIEQHKGLHLNCYNLLRNRPWDSPIVPSCQTDDPDLCPYVGRDGSWETFNIRRWMWEFGEANIHGYHDTFEDYGMKRLGSGCSRVAILAPDGLVYKIERGRQASDCNRVERSTYERLSAQIAAEAFSIAECVLVEGMLVEGEEYVVSVMPRVERMGNELPEEWFTDERVNVEYRMGEIIKDMHRGNWGVDADENIIVIDYGFGSRK